MNKILDEYQKTPFSKELYESIKWWEKRRKYYNLAIGIAGLGPIILLQGWSIFFEGGTQVNLEAIFFNILFFLIGFFVYAFFANLCYCFGWSIDILKSYYYKNPSYGQSRDSIFLLGIIFSTWITFYHFFGVAIGGY